jgi:hypothetical protein
MKKMKNFLTILLCLSISPLFSQGVGFDQQKYDAIEEFDFEVLGFADIPSSYSMRKYAPETFQQVGNSCVGFAMGYSAMSIQYNMQLNITNPAHKRYLSFDPYFIYSLISSQLNTDCNEKTLMPDALKVLENFGCKRFWAAPFLKCNSSVPERAYGFSKPFRIKEFFSIKRDVIADKANLISILKKTISYGIVPIAGIKITNTMSGTDFRDGSVGSDGLWKPTIYDRNKGGHAVSIIGYNDYKFGGAFEIMNSWGRNYGDNGFMWIKYADLANILGEAYIISTYNVSENKCKIGNCYSGYGSEISNGILDEGQFSNGQLNGFGFRTASDGSGIYVGHFKNDKINGRGLIYVAKEYKSYKVNSLNGKILDSEILGFSSDISEEEKQSEELYNAYVKMGYLNIDDLDEETLNYIMDLDFSKKE